MANIGSEKMNKTKGHTMLAWLGKRPLMPVKAVKVVDILGEENILAEAV